MPSQVGWEGTKFSRKSCPRPAPRLSPGAAGPAPAGRRMGTKLSKVSSQAPSWQAASPRKPNANHGMTSQLGSDSEPDNALLSIAHPTGRASRVPGLGGFAVLALVVVEPVTRLGSAVALRGLEDWRDSATDAAGRTINAASKAADNLQDSRARRQTRPQMRSGGRPRLRARPPTTPGGRRRGDH